jgi:hypothetical protein
MGRVVHADGTGRGSLSIAGAVIEADLPKHVRAGAEVRLVVKEVSAERVVLSMADHPAVVPPPAEVPLPGGGSVRVPAREDTEPGGSSSSEQGSYSLSLRYDAPALGPIDLRFQLDRASLRVTAAVSAGDPLSAMEAGAETLRAALAAVSDRTVTVTVAPRREPLDLYA